jgi:AcrR family transcriptional regulator
MGKARRKGPRRQPKGPLEKFVAELIATGTFDSQDEPETPRGRIARAALELFAGQSYEATTTKAIAQRARTTERTLFKHFVSKEQLYARTVFPALLRALVPEVQGVLSGSGDFRTTLRALLVNRITVASQNPALFIMIWRELLTRPAFRSAHQAVIAEHVTPGVDALIAQGRVSGELRDLPADVILRTINAQLVGYLVTRLVIAPARTWDTEADADQVLEAILHGVGRPS